jgi:hypothetical protein
MKKTIILLSLMILAFSANAFAQRKAVSAAEVTGTFKLIGDSGRSSEFKILSLPKGHLKVEFFTALKLGPNGDARGNTASGSGLALISGDTATFTPDGVEPDQCNITIKFVKLGQIKITQEGGCGFINETISTEGIYKRTSTVKPKFTEE